MRRILSKKYAIKFLLISILLGQFLYFSKPDRGGAAACAKTFGLPELSRIELEHQPFWTWEPFESRKYRFGISPEGFSKLRTLLDSNGYSGWVRQGLTFDSVDIGGAGSEDFIVAKRRFAACSFTGLIVVRKT